MDSTQGKMTFFNGTHQYNEAKYGGGAIQINQNAKMNLLSLELVLFDNNNSSLGGAISITGQVNIYHIRKMSFHRVFRSSI